jgi:hypothetical protein
MITPKENKIGDIDYRINMLYDAIYNKNTSECYMTEPILKNNINLIDLKMPNNFDFSSVFKDTKFIENTNNKFYFERKSDSSYSTLIVIEKYKGHIVNDMERTKELYNVLIHYVLSEFVINEKFLHIMLPIMFFDQSSIELKKNNIIYNSIKEHEKEIENNSALFSVYVQEKYFKIMRLSEYLQNEIKNMKILDWKVLFFQVFITLAKITENHVIFRHNKLDLDSIFVYKKNNNQENKKI